jgi:hypothetical protein
VVPIIPVSVSRAIDAQPAVAKSANSSTPQRQNAHWLLGEPSRRPAPNADSSRLDRILLSTFFET